MVALEVPELIHLPNKKGCASGKFALALTLNYFTRGLPELGVMECLWKLDRRLISA